MAFSRHEANFRDTSVEVYRWRFPQFEPPGGVYLPDVRVICCLNYALSLRKTIKVTDSNLKFTSSIIFGRPEKLLPMYRHGDKRQRSSPFSVYPNLGLEMPNSLSKTFCPQACEFCAFFCLENVLQLSNCQPNFTWT